jgi:hypothetical protein
MDDVADVHAFTDFARFLRALRQTVRAVCLFVRKSIIGRYRARPRGSRFSAKARAPLQRVLGAEHGAHDLVLALPGLVLGPLAGALDDRLGGAQRGGALCAIGAASACAAASACRARRAG